MDKQVLLRNATLEDAELIAWAFCEPFSPNTFNGENVLRTVRSEDSIYSYRYTRIAELDGKAVGCCIAYTGKTYAELRKNSIFLLTGNMNTENIALEAETYEYHLDTIAVLGEHRRNGIGEQLMMDFFRCGKAQGYKKFSLMVNRNKDKLKNYYSRYGFGVDDSIRINGYIKMICTKS